jgi:segregation and condensation protein A
VPYEVQTPVFEGPFDLLLHLILREQVDLYEVPLARIVDAYIAELAKIERLDLDVATEFLLIAATLVELKSRRLLPGDDEPDLDEELALWAERDVLLARLLECKTFKDASMALLRLGHDAARSHARTAGPDEQFLGLMPDVLAGITPTDLRAACLRALSPRPRPRIDLDHVAPIRASVTDAVAELLAELPRLGRVTFRRLTSHLQTRLDRIVRFLAVLELYKQGLIDVDQAHNFGELVIVWLGSDAPDAAAMASVIDRYEG